METGNKWFKFYGQDWLTDLKIIRLSVEDRLCYITLLCLASASSEQGTIHECDEEMLIQLSHIPFDHLNDHNPFEAARGCLSRFEELGMITLTVTERCNRSVTDVTVNAFENRQNTLMTNAERQAKYREKMKEKELEQAKSNEKVTPVTTKVTLEKNREEEKRIEKKREEKSEESVPLTHKTELFISSIKEFLKDKPLDQAQAEEIKKFASYWTEPNKSRTRLRWELEKTWDLERRLVRWMSNKSFDQRGNQSKVTKV